MRSPCFPKRENVFADESLFSARRVIGRPDKSFLDEFTRRPAEMLLARTLVRSLLRGRIVPYIAGAEVDEKAEGREKVSLKSPTFRDLQDRGRFSYVAEERCRRDP